MLLGFFEHLRKYRVPVSIRELLDLLSLFSRRLFFADQDDFYFLSRLALVKDEKFYDRFDQAFASYFSGLDDWVGLFDDEEEALREELLKHVREASEREISEALERYREAVRDVKEKREQQATEGESGEGDSGDSGDSGESGKHGEGDDGEEGEGDDGQAGEGLSEEAEEGERGEETDTPQRKATRVWLNREYADYDPDVELGTRNLKMSLRRLRRWARESAELELDLADTIHCTAANGGILDIREVPERHNAVKVLMLLDVGGSMDDHIELCAQLFSAAKSEFKYLESFYFHNFIYESVWHDNERRVEDKLSTWHLIQKFPRDYKVIFVGDADMGRHEIAERGGSVEHFNAEPGEIWMRRIQDEFRHVVWLNPVPEDRWQDSYSIQMIRRMLDGHMYFLSDTGLAAAMKYLMR
jgi:uncharacterized protein with von Willebrand factor type A (vWA) domain